MEGCNFLVTEEGCDGGLQSLGDGEELRSLSVVHPGDRFAELLVHVSAKFELPHDKTNKIACAPSEDSDQPKESLGP